MDDVHGNNINIKTNFIAFKENFYKILTHKLEKIIKTKLKRPECWHYQVSNITYKKI